ncbi:hypothetical protein IMCC20628_03210 [Hoeflea sp. IMCC20628]|nr:hypothetical protein IMCC20628_03210 [Hoeflea sp. IMCC20628]
MNDLAHGKGLREIGHCGQRLDLDRHRGISGKAWMLRISAEPCLGQCSFQPSNVHRGAGAMAIMSGKFPHMTGGHCKTDACVFHSIKHSFYRPLSRVLTIRALSQRSSAEVSGRHRQYAAHGVLSVSEECFLWGHFGFNRRALKWHRDWVDVDVFIRFSKCSGGSDIDCAMVDATIIKVHRHG